MISKTLVFVSSTSHMANERGQLRSRLPRVYEVYDYEEDRARRADPETQCRKMIGQSDVFLGVLGDDYGSSYPGEKRSIVEWEFDTAAAREELEILTFVKELEPGQAREPSQERFVERVTAFRGGHWCKQFSTAEELVERVRASLEEWLNEFHLQVQARRHHLRSLILGLTTFAVLCVVALVVAMVVLPPSAIPRDVMIAASICVVAVVLGAGILFLWSEIGGSHGNG